MAKGVALPNRLPHAAGPFTTGRPCARSWTLRTYSVFYRSAGREGERQFGRHVNISQNLKVKVKVKVNVKNVKVKNVNVKNVNVKKE